MNSKTNHDDVLFHVLQECKTLPNFLDEIFGFLNRRTDFYIVADEPNSAVGLPEGLAEQIVKHTFFKWKPEQCQPIYEDSELPTATIEEITETSDVETNENESPSHDKKPIKEETSFTKSESYNGAVYENYCWSQSITDIDIIVKIPESVTKKDINVDIKPNKISVYLKDNKTLLEGELCHKCKATNAIWSLDNHKLEIHLDKCQEFWWDCLVKTEPKLDISKLDCSRPYEELPEEAQAKLEELQWNHERKLLGLPTSDELAMQETLKKAWNAEGSPFSGPFDPNAVQFGC